MPAKATAVPAQAGGCRGPELARLAEEALHQGVSPSQTELQLCPGFPAAYLRDR